MGSEDLSLQEGTFGHHSANEGPGKEVSIADLRME